MPLAEAQDLAYRRLRDYVKECGIIEVRFSVDNDEFLVVVNDEVDYASVSGKIWRALSHKVNVTVQGKTDFVDKSNSFVCYNYTRWIRC